MNPYDGLFEFLKAHRKSMEQLRESLSLRKQLSEAIKSSIPKIEFPIVKFPKIELPKIEIDYEKIEKLINNNSQHGWTLTGEMNVNLYLNEELLSLHRKQIDDLFTNYYEENSKQNYHNTKGIILDEIELKWKSVLFDCFEIFEAEKYKVIIPMLITIIESEIANLVQSYNFGRRLIREWGNELNEEEKMLYIISHSLYKFLLDRMFVPWDFSNERRSVLNRNWVMHGRDDPEQWTKTDALKLINVLSTLQFIKVKI